MGDGSGVRTQFLSTDGSRRGCAVEIWHFLAVEGPDRKIKVSRSWLFMRGGDGFIAQVLVKLRLLAAWKLTVVGTEEWVDT